MVWGACFEREGGEGMKHNEERDENKAWERAQQNDNCYLHRDSLLRGLENP